MNKVIFQTYQHFYDRMNHFMEENKTVKECDICFVGDSIVEMMEVNDFDGRKCINRGIVSDKSQGVLMTLQDRVIAIKPKIVYLFIGSNDICDGYTIAQIESNIKDIIMMLKENLKDVKIIVGTVTPPCYYKADHVDNAYPDCRDILRLKALNEKIRNLENKEENVIVFDVYSLLADENDSLRLDDTLDGVHLTLKAYKVLKENLKKIL